MPDTKLDLMGYKRSIVYPNTVSGIEDRVKFIHAMEMGLGLILGV